MRGALLCDYEKPTMDIFMKHALSLLLGLCLLTSSAHAFELTSGNYRGVLRFRSGDNVKDGLASTALWNAVVTKNKSEFVVRNTRGFTYHVVPNRLKAGEYLGTSKAQVLSPLTGCLGTPTIRLVPKGNGSIEIHQRLSFTSCTLPLTTEPLSYQKIYSGSLSLRNR
jgi:hypothetical protein